MPIPPAGHRRGGGVSREKNPARLEAGGNFRAHHPRGHAENLRPLIRDSCRRSNDIRQVFLLGRFIVLVDSQEKAKRSSRLSHEESHTLLLSQGPDMRESVSGNMPGKEGKSS